MGRLIFKFALALLTVYLGHGVAFAQNSNDGDGKRQWIFGARASYFFDNTRQRASFLDGLVSVNEQVVENAFNAEAFRLEPDGTLLDVELFNTQGGISNDGQSSFEMVGGSGTLISKSGNTAYTLAASYGEDSFETSITNTNTVFFNRGAPTFDAGAEIVNQDIVNATSIAQNDVERLDIEFTVQHNSERLDGLRWLFGAKYENLSYDTFIRSEASSTLNRANQIALNLGASADDLFLELFGPLFEEREVSFETNQYTARAGFSAERNFAGLLSNGGEKHSAYVQALGHVSHVDSDNGSTETFIGPDLAAGYRYAFNRNVSLDLRYRTTIYYPVAGDFDFDDPRITHGPEVGLSFAF